MKTKKGLPVKGTAKRSRPGVLAWILIFACPAAVWGADSVYTLDGSGVQTTITSGANMCADDLSLLNSARMTGTGTWCAGPTLVGLSYFFALPLNETVRVQWGTAFELDNVVFHLWRSTAEDRDYLRITETPIPAAGDAWQGADYDYEDGDVEPAKTYWYRLEDIDSSGTSTYHGPIHVVTSFGAPWEVSSTLVRAYRPAAGSDRVSVNLGSLGFVVFPLLAVLLWRKRSRNPRAP